MKESTVVLVTLVVYKIILVAVGLLTRSRTRDAEDFFLGGRKLGPAIAALSASASSSSAWTLLGVSGVAFSEGLCALWLFPSCVGGFCLNWLVVAPRLQRVSRSTGALTVTELLAGPRGAGVSEAVRALASMIVVVFFTVYVAAQFQGAGAAFADVLRGSELVQDSAGDVPAATILIGAAIVVFYTLLGGFWAVSITDTLQGLMMAAAAVILPMAALHHLGLDRFVDGIAASSEDYRSLFRGAAPMSAIGLVLGYFGIGLGYPGQPHVVNRFMALADEPGAVARARAIAIGWAVVVYAGMITFGLCAHVILADAAAKTMFFECARAVLHPVVAGVIVAAVLSAIMSTADSQLLVAGSAVTHDLGIGSGSPRRMLLTSRLVVLLLSGVAVVVCLAIDDTIYNRVLFAWSVMGAAFGPALLARVFGREVTATRVLASMIAGLVLVVASKVWWNDPTGVLERIVPILVSSAIVFVPGSRAPARETT